MIPWWFVISAIYWYGYESIKSLMLKKDQKQELAFTESFMAGAASGTVGPQRVTTSVSDLCGA